MRSRFCLILSLLLAAPAGGQTRADTLAVFEAAARTLGYIPATKGPPWFVVEGDSLTLRFARHIKQPTNPAPKSTVYCSGGSAGPGDVSGHIETALLTFQSLTKATFTLTSQCTMRRGRTWAFMSGDSLGLELKDGVWVVTDHAMLIS